MKPGMYEARNLETGAVAYVVLDDDGPLSRKRFAVAYTELLRVRWRVGGATRERIEEALRAVGDMGED